MSKTIIERDFWVDSLIIDEYSPEDKLFMLYLLTCPKGNTIGIFKLPIKLMAFEIGYSPEAIRTLIERFDNKYDRIKYDFTNQEIAIKNALKYSISKGGTPVENMVTSELKNVGESNLILYVYKNMAKIWDSSDRPIDKSVKELFENELARRNVNVNDYVNVNVNVNDYVYVYGDSGTIRARFEDDSQKCDDFNVSSNDENYDSYPDSYPDSYTDFSQEVVEQWNNLDKNVPKITTLKPGTQRYSLFTARVNQYGKDNFLNAIEQINKSSFLKGYKTDFIINFDWFVRPNNFIKVLEGNYVDRDKEEQSNDDFANQQRQKRFAKMLEENEKIS